VHRPQSVTRALANMVGAAALFAVLNAAVKSLRGEIPTIQLVWVRTLGHLLFVVAAFAPRYGLRLFETRHPVFQLVRSCLLLASTVFYFTALGFVGLATAATISFMTPCLIAVLAGPLLGEHVGGGGGPRSRRGSSACWSSPGPERTSGISPRCWCSAARPAPPSMIS